MREREQLLERIRATVRPEEGWLPSFIYTHPGVYQLELERIFQRAWLFVAHESEVAQPGDYVTRSMGEQPVIVTRGEDGAVRVLLNVCVHRGMRVARAEMGNSSHFRCAYHGFTYTSTGALIGVPFQREAYGELLDRSRLCLRQARVDSYRGLLFATWDPAAPPLGEYLGDLRWYLDILAGRAEMEVMGPPQRWSVPCGWKLPAENFASDAYHTAHTHASVARLGLVVGSVDFARAGYHIDPGHGHGLGLGTQEDGPAYPPELLPELRRNLEPRQLALLDRLKNLHGTIFPNCSFLINSPIRFEGRLIWSTTLRVWNPRGPNRVEVVSWCLVERNAPGWWKALTQRAYIQTFGSSGMLEQDDTENWEAQTRNFTATLPRDDLVLNYQMGLDKTPLADFPGPGLVFESKFNEHNARQFYRRWRQYLLDGE